MVCQGMFSSPSVPHGKQMNAHKWTKLWWAHLDTTATLAAGRRQNSQARMPALRGAAVPAAGSRGFPAPSCFRRLSYVVAMSTCARGVETLKLGWCYTQMTLYLWE